MSQTPDHGARYQLRRETTDGDQAHYQGQIATSRGPTFTYRVTMDRAGGSATLELAEASPEGTAPTEDELRFFTTLARTVCRGAQKGSWPRWINRWRG